MNIDKTQKTGIKSIVVFYSLTCLFSWTVWAILLKNPELKFLHLVGGLGPALGFLTLMIKAKSSKDILASFRLPKRIIWLFIGISLPWIIMLMSVLVNPNGFNIKNIFINDEFPDIGIWYMFLSIFFYGIGEELGWRKYLIPNIKKLGLSLKVSNLIFTPFWALWHLPLFWYQYGYAGMDFSTIMGWIFALTLGSILLAYIYKNSSKSILPVALFHGTLDVVMLSTSITESQMILMNIIVLLLGLSILLITDEELNLKKLKKSK